MSGHKTKHDDFTYCYAQESMGNAADHVDTTDPEVFLVVAKDGDNATAHVGGNLSEDNINAIIGYLEGLKEQSNKKGIYSYLRTENAAAWTEVESGFIQRS